MDYPAYLVETLLQHHDEIESIKFRVTPTLSSAEANPPPKDESFYDEPGHTLMAKGSKTTRVPYNSNRRIEALSDMTADLEMARRAALSPAEDLALIAFYTGLEVSDFVKDEARKAFIKVCRYMNYAE